MRLFRKLRYVFNELPKELRIILWYRYETGTKPLRTIYQVSKLMNCSDETIRKKIKYSFELLKNIIHLDF